MLDQISKTVGHCMVSFVICIIIFMLVCVVDTRSIFTLVVVQDIIHLAAV
jgi:hypothetical protein